MNWNQYFKLKEKQKKIFWALFIIFAVFHSLYVKNDIAGNLFCDIDICKEAALEEQPQLIINISNETLNNQTNTSKIGLNETNITINLAENNTLQEPNNTSALNKPAPLDYLWPVCNFNCELTQLDKINIWVRRFIYTPLLIFTDLLAAYLLSIAVYFYTYCRTEHKKKIPEQKEEPKQ